MCATIFGTYENLLCEKNTFLKCQVELFNFNSMSYYKYAIVWFETEANQAIAPRPRAGSIYIS